MRVFLHLAILLLVVLPLAAGEHAVRGAESILGPVDLASLATDPASRVVMASDGDEVVVLWIGRGSLYGQRLDRNGFALTPLPRLLLRDFSWTPRVIYAGGFYCLVYGAYEKRTVTRVLRLTRELDIADTRVIESGGTPVDVVRAGDEIQLLTTVSVLRLRDDLSLIARLPNTEGTALAPSPRGTLVVTANSPALTARMLDDSSSVRIESMYKARGAAAVWTGRRYLVAWSDNGLPRAVTLDEDLRLLSGTINLETNYCSDCRMSITLLGNDDALVTWQSVSSNSRALRFVDGAVTYSQPLFLGLGVSTFRTAGGLVLTVDNKLRVRSFVPGAVAEPAAQPVLSTISAAAEEGILAVAKSATEVAVARSRSDGKIFVTILDHEGRTLREVRIADGWSVALTHDGRDFYALVHGSPTNLQKVAEGAPVTRIKVSTASALAWTGSAFLILETGYIDYTGRAQSRTRPLWLAPDGTLSLPPCPMWEFSTISSDRTRIMSAGGELYVMVGNEMARVPKQCSTAPPEPLAKIVDGYAARFAWRDGIWARAVVDKNTYTLSLSLAPDLTSAAENHPVPAPRWMSVYDVAPAADGWLVAYRDGAILRSAMYDAAGHLIGTSVLAESTNGIVRLVPVSGDRVLAIYQRQVFEPPYLGVTRVIAAPVTIESASRRRTARP